MPINLSPKARMRIVAVFPLLFFVAQLVHYWKISQLGNLAWMCNIGNLILAIGLFFDKPVLVRVSAIWMIPGLFVWLRYVVFAWGVFFSSTLAHLGGLTVGMWAIREVRMDNRTWVYAFGWSLVLQLFSRLFTSPNLNVNLAHRIQDGMESTFRTYWFFWLVLTLTTAAVLWALGRLLAKLWPVRAEHKPQAKA